jgi:hypothetical protein
MGRIMHTTPPCQTELGHASDNPPLQVFNQTLRLLLPFYIFSISKSNQLVLATLATSFPCVLAILHRLPLFAYFILDPAP